MDDINVIEVKDYGAIVIYGACGVRHYCGITREEAEKRYIEEVQSLEGKNEIRKCRSF